ncbi:MAG TPA: FtsQ-type POTRA domain-containing protein [Methylocella sp.]|nr:FtsQ-type POTRA domain-containing protein [Methylocella sp.]
MDGRGRLLRSVRFEANGAPAALAYPSALSPPPRFISGRRQSLPLRPLRRGWRGPLFDFLAKPLVGFGFSLSLLTAVGAYGIVEGGHYTAFVAAVGEPADLLAKSLGFPIRAVTISGEHELKDADLLAVAGITSRNSLLFLNVGEVRDRLQRLALIKQAIVTKRYPDRLVIEIEEREPFALWQYDGKVQIVAADGVPLDAMRDRRFIHLPLVVGANANERLGQYLSLLDAAGELRDKIVAGVWVAGRRWTLKTANGVDILLPEAAPEAALVRLAALEKTAQILDKDLISVDLREPGRLMARLTAEAAAERAGVLDATSKGKGGH